MISASSNTTNEKPNAPFKEKTRVVLQGLVNKPEWNGKKGTVMKSSLTKDGRQAVLVHDGINETVGLKLSNMRPMELTIEERRDEFWTEMVELKDRIDESKRSSRRDRNGHLKQYKATKTSISKLREFLNQAERHISLLPELDDGEVEPRHQFCPEEYWPYPSPPPSIMKTRAWNNRRHAQAQLAEALEGRDNYEEALTIYQQMVEQAMEGRREIWDAQDHMHITMNNLGLCYKRNGNFEEAIYWYENGLELAEEEEPFSSTCQLLRDNLSNLKGNEAGPACNPSNVKACWNCGKDPKTITTGLLKCSKCYDLKVATPALYCSPECQREDWKRRHKEYHSRLKDTAKFKASYSSISTDAVDEVLEMGSDAEKLVAEALQARKEGNHKRAKKLLNRALKADSKCFQAHYNLANVWLDSRSFQQAIHHFTAAKEIIDANAEGRKLVKLEETMWGRSVASIWCSFDHQSECRSFPKPEWMLDPRTQQRVGERAVKFSPDYNEAWALLGDAFEQQEKARAVDCFQRASSSSKTEVNQTKYQRRAENVAQKLGLN